MSRKVIPIVIAAVAVVAILMNGERRRDDENKPAVADEWTHSSKHDRRKAREESSTHYALDVRRASWPPLAADGANVPMNPQAMNTVNYYIVLDGSGSMLHPRCSGGTTKIEVAIAAVKHFVDTVPANANIGLAAFDRRSISERVPLGVDNRDALRIELGKITAGADTPLLSTIRIGYEKLTAQARAQLGYGEYHLVVVTDGQPDPDSEDPKPVVKEILEQSPVVLHTIGFCIDSDHVLNQPNKTYYVSATDPEQLDKSLQAVLAEAPVFDATHFN